MVGETISHYRILSKLGEGGMGIIYKAEDLKLARRVALKFLPPAVGEREKTRLVHEAQAIAQLDHPNICTVFEVDDTGDSPFIAMAYIEGKTLKERLEKGPLPIPEVLEYAQQIARGLQAAHRKHVTHRDIKSSNIMVTPEGQIKVMDFGLAKQSGRTQLTRDGSTLGTVAYMSPEQARGEEVDQRTDLWSFGVVLYELLTGRLPFQSEYETAVVYSILNDTPAPIGKYDPEVPPELEALVLRLLQKRKEDRYQSADEVLLELEGISGSARRGFRLRKLFIGRRRLLYAAALFALLLMAAAVCIWKGMLKPPGIESVAVLPLENLSGNSDQEYLVEGIHDALITDLAKLGGLKKVISRQSVMRFKGKNTPTNEIARQLGVDALVTGAVVRAGNSIRVTTQLVNPFTESSLWAESYERELRDVLSLQNEIVSAIAAQLQLRLSPEKVGRVPDARPINPEIYEAYLRGMYWLHRGTPEGTKKGIAFLQEAVDKDPGDARAYAGLSLGYMTVAHGPDPPTDALAFARAASERAIRLDSTLDMPYVASGFLKAYHDYDWDAAMRLMNRAISINPQLAIAYYHLSWFHVILGRMDEALVEHKRAKELDPLLPLHTAWLGDIYRRLGRFDEAIAECRRAIDIDPNSPIGHMILGRVFTEQHQYAEAFKELEKAGQVAPAHRFAIGIAYAAAGRLDDARRVLAELEQLEITPWWARQRAELHMALGERDDALRWLNYEPRTPLLPGIRVSQIFKSLHGDPHFNEILKKMNLPPPED
jgi:TolB-like protein/predicted Ser/Thr protein kinase